MSDIRMSLCHDRSRISFTMPISKDSATHVVLTRPTAILSYRALLVVIVSQNSSALVFTRYHPIITRYVGRRVITQMCLCQSTEGEISHHFGGVLACLTRYRLIWGIAAIVSQYLAMWCHYFIM